MIAARLQIWINKKPVLQGKFYFREHRPVFLFNVDKNKWMDIYKGYGIAEQILEGFAKSKLHVQIIAKNTDTHICYTTKRTTIYKKGIKAFYGGHTQWFLPLKNWEVFRDHLSEPFGLPKMTMGDWLVEEDNFRRVEDASMPVSVWEKLKKLHPETIAKIRGDVERKPNIIGV